MRVLLVDPHRTERLATEALIPADCHQLTPVRDAVEALALLENDRDAFDVVIVEAVGTTMTGAELVKRIRASEHDRHIYIIVTASRTVPGDLRTAFAAGADDFIRKPIVRDELIARLEAPTRIRQWASRLIVGAIQGASSSTTLTSSLAWTAMESTIGSELSDMIGATLTSSGSARPLDQAKLLASTTLTLPTEQIEIRLALGLDDATASVLAGTLLGDSDADLSMRCDMVRELANVAAGGLKRAALLDGRTLTTGVPVDTTVAELRAGNPTAAKHWLATSGDGGPTLRIEVELRVRAPKRIRLCAVREGMVVAVDLRNAMGGLLMRSGTRIVESSLRSLRSSLGAEACIDVLEAA